MKKFLRILTIFLFVGCLGLTFFPSTIVQAEIIDTPEIPGKWRDWASHDLQDIAQTIPDAKERQEYVAALTKIYEIFRRAKPLNPPVGFEITRYRSVQTGTPIPGTFRLMFFGYYRTGPQQPVQVHRETAATVDVYINSISVLEKSDYPVAGDDKGYFVYAPNQAGMRYGYPVYHRAPGLKPFARIVLTNIKRPLFVPVSRERYLRSLIQKEEAEIKRLTASYNQAKQEKGNFAYYETMLKIKKEQKQVYEDELAAMSEAERLS